MNNEQTVSEYLFKLGSESLLEELADQSEYWGRAHDFVQKNYDKQLKTLSAGQQTWLTKIQEGLIEEASK